MSKPRYHARVITISAEDSPNVAFARWQQSRGVEPTDEVVTPGVLTWGEFQQRLATWDEMEVEIGLHARFYKGKELLLFPPAWLEYAAQVAEKLKGKPRRAEAIGIDPGEGGADTTMYAIDRFGVVAWEAKKTPDTSVIPDEALAFMRYHGVPAERVAFDRGGGGLQAADHLRRKGFAVRTIAFGESVVPDPRRGMTRIEEKIEQREERYSYFNKRAMLYGTLSLMMDPSYNPEGFAIPYECVELRRQLAPMPKTYDPEGRLKLPPKNKRTPSSKERSLTEILGRSPDDADALVIAVDALTHAPRRAVAGAM